MFKKVLLAVVVVVSFLVIGCEDSDVVSANISRAAHQFEVFRRVVFYNGITNDYILEVRAFCSVVPESDGRLSVTIKTEDGTFLKHYLGLSDNVTYFCEQIQASAVSDKHYQVIFKPSVIVPNMKLIGVVICILGIVFCAGGLTGQQIERRKKY
jgi:hypothetical protein